MTTFVCIDFWASKQVPLIWTSSQHQRKAVQRICSASLDKQWLEEFALQITVLNDREFSIATQKSNSIQELETPGLHPESKSDLLTEKLEFYWFAWIRKKTNFTSEYGFQPYSDHCKTRFVGTHQNVTGAEHPSRIENKMFYLENKIFYLLHTNSQICIAQAAATPPEESEVFCSNLGIVTKMHVLFFWDWLVLKIPQLSKRTCDRFVKMNYIVLFCLYPISAVRHQGLLCPKRIAVLTSPTV